MKAQKRQGIILYRGPSMLDGSPIVAVATFGSRNVKTGAMVQTWILSDDGMNPVAAAEAGHDASVCGACPHRRSLGGACYVNLGQAPLAVYKAAQRGSYTDEWSGADFAGRMVRMGSYGDPAAVPASVWREVLSESAGWTGYTHQARHKAFQPELLEWVMVSADTPKQAAQLHSQGLRTFRVKTAESPMLPGEIECLADSQGLSCVECGMCDGARKESASIAITVHGSLSGRYVNKYGNANIIAVSA